MNISAYNNLRVSLYDALDDHRLLDAILKIEELAVFTNQPLTVKAAYTLRQDYAMLLSYMKRSLKDLDRQTYFANFVCRAYRLADELCRNFTLNHIPCTERNIWKRLHLPAEAVADVYVPFVEGTSDRPATITEILADPLASYQQLFDTVWTSPHWKRSLRQQLVAYTLNGDSSEINRLTLVSAVGLALLFCFDEEKFLYLFDVIQENEVQTSVRALVMVLLAYGVYFNRIDTYPEISLKYNMLNELPMYHPLCIEVQKAFCAAVNSPRLANVVDKDLPKRIANAHEQMKGLPEGAPEEEIEAFIKSHPKLRKFHHEMVDMMKDFVKMQLLGVDMSYHSFKKLKNLVPFFSEAANWFSPFSYDHPTLFNISAAGRFLGVIAQNKACDTERFAIVLSMAPHLPEIHVIKQDAITMKEEKMEGEDAVEFIEKMAETMGDSPQETDESLITIDRSVLRRHVVCCVQDLYRFFNLFAKTSQANDDDDSDTDETEKADAAELIPYTLRANPFMHCNFCVEDAFSHIFAPEDVKREMAEFYFEIEEPARSLNFYRQIEQHEEEHHNMAMCYFELGNTQKAQAHLRNAMEYAPDNEYLKLTLAKSYCDEKNYDLAIPLLEELVALNPDNNKHLIMLAEVYMKNSDFESARQLYEKIHYIHPEHIPSMRALAWCHLSLEHYAKASDFYLRIIDSGQATAEDFLNAGHCHLLQDDMPSAVVFYQESLRADHKEFAPVDFFDEDAAFLIVHGISYDMQQIIIDLLNM